MHATQNCAWCTQCIFLSVSLSIDDAIVGNLPLWAIIVIPLVVLLALIIIAIIVVVVVVVKLYSKDKLCKGESVVTPHTCAGGSWLHLCVCVCMCV